MKDCTDLQYDLSGDSAIVQETVPVIGPWTDYTGSDPKVSSKAQQFWAGMTNTLQGTDAALMGAKVGVLGEVGQNKQTTRRRVIRRYVDFGKRN